MKNTFIIFSASLLLAGAAHAKDYTCKENPKWVKDNGSFSVGLKVRVNSPTSVLFAFKDKGSKATIVKPDLDKKFKSQSAARFVDSATNISQSDSGETSIFISKSLLFGGKSGHVTVSSNQANDGDTGPQFLWGKVGVYDCAE